MAATPNKRRMAAMLAMVGLLAGLVALDQGAQRGGAAGDRGDGMDELLGRLRPPMWSERHRKLREVVHSQQAVASSYAQYALAYAERMAPLGTFQLRKVDPRRAAERIVRSLVPRAGSVKLDYVNVGQAEKSSETVSLVGLDVRLTAGTHQGALAALYALGNPENGVAWRDFTLRSDPQSRTISLTGRLQSVVVESVE